MTDEPTRFSRRRRGDDAAAPAVDDATRVSSRGDRTQASRRRVAEGETQPAPETDEPTRPASRTPGAAPAKADAFRPPEGLRVSPTRRGGFGDDPQHYYPRARHTQAPHPSGIWPASAADPRPSPEVLAPEDRAARDTRSRRGRAMRMAAVAAGLLAAGAAAAAIVAIL
ncbi:hypothetical protein [Demequina sp.]|uniref:hypothetical protein n=1 Tax=Demequina sp. TaxID=2050685 RepID=UPI0025F14BD0|nr:hypothetical protein [Demequina sp.]